MKDLMLIIAPIRSTLLVAAIAASCATPAMAQVAQAAVPARALPAALSAAAQAGQPGQPNQQAVSARDSAAVPMAPPLTSNIARSDSPDLWKLRKEHEDQDTELRLEIATARLQKKLNDIRNGKDTDDSGGQSAMARPGMYGSPMMPPQSAPTTPAPVEKVTSVDDIFTSPKINDNHPSATIRLPSGETTTVMAGTRVAGLGTITSVTRDQVVYRDTGGHEAALPFSSGAEQ